MHFSKAALWLFSPQVIFVSLPYLWAVLGTKDAFNKWMTFTHATLQTQRPVALCPSSLQLLSISCLYFFSLSTKSPSSNTFSTLAVFLKCPAIAVIYSFLGKPANLRKLKYHQLWPPFWPLSTAKRKKKEKKQNQAIGANINIWSSTLAGPSVLTNSTQSTVSPILHRNGFKPFPLA